MVSHKNQELNKFVYYRFDKIEIGKNIDVQKYSKAMKSKISGGLCANMMTLRLTAPIAKSSVAKNIYSEFVNVVYRKMSKFS